MYKYKYIEKEWQDEMGLNWYDYGARNYDSVIGRFFNMDRFSEKYKSHTSFHYTVNNPIYFIDVKGDSLVVNNNQGKTAITTFKSIVEYGLGGLYTLNQSSTGKFVLDKTSDGVIDKGQQAFFETLNGVMTSSNDVVFDAVDRNDSISQNIYVGDNGTATGITATPGVHTLDVDDINSFGTGGLLTSQGVLGHEIKEGQLIQSNKSNNKSWRNTIEFRV